MLQEENHHLLDSLEDQLDAMRRAESQMHSIVSLMNLFNSKVLQQEEQIGTIYDNTVNSTSSSKANGTSHTMLMRANHPTVTHLSVACFSRVAVQARCTCTLASVS
jgi:t-SNARE complex subunit (syntaxin)